MQAQRGGAYATSFDAEAPQSSQAFMSDLKNLAVGLQEFDDSRQPRAVAPPAASRAQLGQQQTYPQMDARMPMPGPSPKPQSQPQPQPKTSASQSQATSPSPSQFQMQIPDFSAPADFEAPPETQTAPETASASAAFSGSAASVLSASSLAGDLNERSLQMLREVQLALNLTSESETMNMMIALAHKSLKSLLA